MGKTLTERLKRGAASIGLAGALALGGSGCIGPMYSAMGAGMTAQGNKFGPAYSALGDGMTRLEAAEEGRSETKITLNYGTPPEQKYTEPPKQKLPLIYTCTGTEEDILNRVNLRDMGRKIFYSGETIGIIGIISGSGELTNYNKCITTGKSSPLFKKDAWKDNGRCGSNCALNADFLIENRGEGEYENVWFLDGKEVGRVRYSVFKRKE